MPDSSQPLAFSAPPPLRVVVIAEDPLVRGNLASILAVDAGIRVVGQDSPQAAPGTITSIYRPDVVVWDTGWQGAAGDGWEELGRDGILVIVLVPAAAEARPAWEAGARGVLARDASPERLRAALEAVAHGLTVLEPDILESIDRDSPRPESFSAEPLTERELEVLRQVGAGLSNKEIATRLAISESTVKFHVNSILGKLGAQSRTEAAMRAARAGLIPL